MMINWGSGYFVQVNDFSRACQNSQNQRIEGEKVRHFCFVVVNVPGYLAAWIMGNPAS